MSKFRIVTIVFSVLFVNVFFISAQNIKLFCKSAEMVNLSLANHPEKQLVVDQIELFTQQYLTHPNEKQIYTIPVVFHIIHEYGTENISDAQILDEMRVINEDFSLNNADAVNIVSAFTGIAANAGFVFKLAKKDPNGNCTNGIERIVSTETFIGDDNSKLNPWPSNKYLNVWVVKSIDGAAAYAYLPGTAPSGSVDGIIMRSDYCGSIGTSSLSKSHTLSHEVGHFFNLKHTWGSTNSPGVSCGNDNVNDTPTTEGWSQCNLAGATCSSSLDNVQNFMEYSYCSCMFKEGQKSRMIASLTNTWGGRNNLWTSNNLVATGLSGPTVVCTPVADFIASAPFICVGSSIDFSDVSTNGFVDTRSWTANGGTATSLTDSVITVSYTTPGTYNVSLTVTNTAGTDAVTKNSIVTVMPLTAMYNAGYTEDFENHALPGTDWMDINIGPGNGFSIGTTAHYNGTKSLTFINSTTYANGVYNAVGPTLDMTAVASPILTFHVAYAQRTTADADKLRLMVSTDCGKNWIQAYVKLGTGLKTVASPVAGSFVPSSQADWRTETVTLNNFVSNTDLRIKFEFTSRGGNNVFIDDINLGGFSYADFPIASAGLQVFPNPADNHLLIESLAGNVPTEISVYDVAGKLIQQFVPENSTSELNIAAYAAGIYFLKARMIDGSILTRKFVKN